MTELETDGPVRAIDRERTGSRTDREVSRRAAAHRVHPLWPRPPGTESRPSG